MSDSTKHLYKICPNCDYFCNMKEEIRYCPNCGTELIQTCNECGAGISYPYANFCGFCGKPYRKNKNRDYYEEI